MPLVLALAPNGAITQGVPSKCTEKDWMEAYVSSGTAKCLKALQDRKLVLLCIHNKKTKSSKAALKGVRDFKADDGFADFTEIISVDPTDQKEKEFLTSLRVDPSTKTAVTLLLEPPGVPIGQFSGAVSKVEIMEELAAAHSGCCSGGCGSGSCGPAGCGF